MRFTVLDHGKEVDTEEIALREEWAKGLMFSDMDGFALTEDGTLILLDECGNFRFCPRGRFTVVLEID